MDSLVGTTLGGYKLEAELDHGPGAPSLGETFAARDRKGRELVVKIVHSQLSLFAQVEAFWKAQNTLAELSTPYIGAPTESTWTDSGRFLMVAPRFEGLDLSAVLQRGALVASQVLRFAGQVCVALEAAHGASVMHGRLTPRNVLLVPRKAPDGTATFTTRVTDFAGHLLLDEGEAPKVADDVRAIALLMVQALVGDVEVSLDDAAARMTSSDGQAKVPKRLAEILLGALSETPSKRPASVAALREALEGWAATKPAELAAKGSDPFASAPKDGAAPGVDPSKDEDRADQTEEPDTVATEREEKKTNTADSAAPEDAELAAMAELAAAPLREARKKRKRKKQGGAAAPAEATAAAPASKEAAKADEVDEAAAAIAEAGAAKAKATAAKAKATASKAKSSPAKKGNGKPAVAADDGKVHEETVTLPVERTVRAYVDGISPTVPTDGEEEDGDGDLDLALDGFMRDAKKTSAALPPAVVDDARLAELAKAKLEPDPAPAPAPAPVEPVASTPIISEPQQQKSSVGTMLLAALIGALVAGGAIYALGGDKGKKTPTPDPTPKIGTSAPVATPGTSKPAVKPSTPAKPKVAATKPDAGAPKADTQATAKAQTPDAAVSADSAPAKPAATAKKPTKKPVVAAKKPTKKPRKATAKKPRKPRKVSKKPRKPRKPRKPKKPKKPKKKGGDWVDPFAG